MAIGDKVFIADKPTLDAVNTKVGATTDTGGTTAAGGIFAKLNAILQQFLSNWTAVRAIKLDNLDVAVSSRASAEDLKKINSNLANPLDNLIENKVSDISSWLGDTNNLIHTLKTGTVPIVKSVQRGTVSDNTMPAAPVTVTINNINVNKSIILVFGMAAGNGHPCGQILSSTSISVFGGGDSNARNQIAWQVIEFY